MATDLIEAPPDLKDSWKEERDREQVDTTVDIVTPENIAFHYRVAGPFRRLPAYLIDLALRLLFFFVLAIVFSVIAGFSRSQFVGLTLLAVWVVLAFVSVWFYGGLFETYMNGQTPGKWIMGIRVLTVEGQPINMLQAV